MAFSLKSDHKIIFLASLGAGLEFFDFTIYALFANYLSLNFFPQDNPLIGLINTFAVFALGYLARPIGGLILGHIGDKYGRKNAFTLALLIMALATLGIGCLPNYNHIGLTATILLISLRLIQGLSVGGELPGAVIFTMEHFSDKKPGFVIGIVFMFITLSSAVASLIGYALNHLFSQTAMLAWGWRIPFMLGFLVGIVGYILRRRSLETPAFLALLHHKQVNSFPLIELLKKSPKALIKGFSLTAMVACFVSFLLFFPTYLTAILQYSASTAYLASTLGFVLLGILCPLSGYLSDIVGRKAMLIMSALTTIVGGYFVFFLLITKAFTLSWLSILILVVTVSIANGCYALAIAEQFPVQTRYSGVGLCYNLGYALFGGLTPLILATLIKATALTTTPYFYLVGCTLLTLIASLAISKKVRSINNDKSTCSAATNQSSAI